jgi:hypothetical protein
MSLVNVRFFQFNGPRLCFFEGIKRGALFYPKIVMGHYYGHKSEKRTGPIGLPAG